MKHKNFYPHHASERKDPALHFFNKAIEWSFYILFFTVPLVMFPTTFELFEFNKMWFVFGMSLFILFFWACKVILEGKLTIRRTPLDIPILLFLLSQIISTVFSIDSHVSFWGYYSRFNGGLLSTLSYIFLYYAFASNVLEETKSENVDSKETSKFSIRMLIISLISGLVVALWGLPSHFGYDPTCLVFRGSFDVSCWTDAFHPTVRIFSTQGQPNWLAAQLAILIPIAIAFVTRNSEKESKTGSFFGVTWKSFAYFLLIILFFFDLLYTASQSGFLGLLAGMAVITVFVFFVFFKKSHVSISKKQLYLFIASILIISGITFFRGAPVGKIQEFMFPTLKARFLTPPNNQSTALQKAATADKLPTPPGQPALEYGGTDSLKIRQYVWQGAVNVWKQYPLFGSGVETFAYAFYKVKPKEHNLTSEWDFLYNKAHNEYLNYLATTGFFGLGTYLLMIAWFFITAVKYLFFDKKHTYSPILPLALLASYIAILVSNFFGFSVVTVNLFMFMIPIFFYDIVAPSSLRLKTFHFSKQSSETLHQVGAGKVIGMIILGLFISYLQLLLFLFWLADKNYSLGYNHNKAGHYGEARQPLLNAVSLRSGEDTFKDELSVNNAYFALYYAQQNQMPQAQDLARQAKELSDEVVLNHPNNVVFFKTRTRVLFTLSQIDKRFLPETLQAIEHAHELAPADAKVAYNLGLIYQEAGRLDDGIKAMLVSKALKPNYREAYYGLGILYTQKSKDLEKTNPAESKMYKDKAIESFEFILKYISPTDGQTKELLKGLKG